MPRPPLTPITQPSDLARTRRVALALWLLFALAWLTAWTMYHIGTSFIVRSFSVFPIQFLGFGLGAWLVRSFRLHKRASPLLPRPLGVAFILPATLGGMSFFIAFLAHPTVPTDAYTALIGGPILIAGVVLAGFGLFGKRPGEPICPECNYPTGGLTLPTPCPECAEPLNPDAVTLAAVPDFSRRTALAGVGLITLAVAFMVLMRVTPATFYRALPDAVHFRLAASEAPAFDALDRTNLTRPQREQLAERIINARHRRDQIFLSPQIDWLSAQIAAGSVRPEIVHRFAVEGFNPVIIARTLPNGDTEISIAANPPLMNFSDLTQYYFFSGFEINDAPPIARDSTPRDTYNIADDWPRRQSNINRAASRNRPTDIYPLATLPPADNPVRIRARIITVLTSNLVTPTIAWQDDGSFTITPSPLHTAELNGSTTLPARGPAR